MHAYAPKQCSVLTTNMRTRFDLDALALASSNKSSSTFINVHTFNHCRRLLASDDMSGFVANTPVVDDGETGDLMVDLDALAQESAAAAFTPKTDISDLYVKEERKAPRQAGWFPLILSPTVLDGTYAGDVGFDPFGLAKDESSLAYMREAELKHSRLAMLAAAGWPLSELWHKEIAGKLTCSVKPSTPLCTLACM
jgi:Chlorophyll A-B binding protein